MNSIECFTIIVILVVLGIFATNIGENRKDIQQAKEYCESIKGTYLQEHQALPKKCMITNADGITIIGEMKFYNNEWKVVP